jgi:acyl-CoA thioesterase-2
MLDLLDLRALGGDVFDAPAMAEPLNDALFGGQAIAQSLRAAGMTVAEGLVPASLHAYFDRPGIAAEGLRVEVERVDDGARGSLRYTHAFQGAREVFSMRSLFREPAALDATVRSPVPPVPGPDAELQAPVKNAMANIATTGRVPDLPEGLPWRPPRAFWGRTFETLPDDPMIHACALAYVSDMGSGFSGLDIGDIPPGGPSLDHAAWFLQPVRADEWLWNDLVPLSTSGARALYRGTITSHTGVTAVLVMQEMSMRPNRAFWQTASAP